jgi:YgiT-type zinc finger domain-containing protein
VECRELLFTAHAVTRMAERAIRGAQIRWVPESGEIIESEPNDVPYPSHLILGFFGSQPLHVLATSTPQLNDVTPLLCMSPTRPGGLRIQKEIEFMKCVICRHGETAPGVATVTLQRGDSTVIIKGVPADICDNCTEYYLNEAVTEKVLEQADAALRAGAELEVRRYAA